MSRLPRSSRDVLATACMAAAAAAMFGLAVAGGVRHFSMVPFWDSWHAYLDFYAHVKDGQAWQWWAFHNEHRIILARLLFWIDLDWLGGTGVFLIVVNYLLVFAAFLLLRAILRERVHPHEDTPAAHWATLFVFGWLYAWMQHENLTWTFQSQFFLAQSLPLLALWLLHRAAATGSDRWFAAACATGVLCLGTMGSGVLALPLLTASAAILRMPARRVLLLAAGTVACVLAYFHGFETPRGHGNVRDGLAQPLELARYVLLYLGSPVYHVMGGRSVRVPQLAGALLLALAAWQAVRVLRRPRPPSLDVVLLAYVAYIVGTAIGTGAGRLPYGLLQATASRYTTPAIMGWLALLLLYLPALLPRLAAWQWRAIVPAALLAASAVYAQRHALQSQRAVLFERDVAALAVTLGVVDDAQIRTVYYHPESAITMARKPLLAQRSVFAQPAFRMARTVLGTAAPPASAQRCRGIIVRVEDVPRAPEFKRVTGWIAPAAGENAITAVRIAAGGTVEGYALAGELMHIPQPDPGIGRDLRVFKGYVHTTAAYAPLVLHPVGADCSVEVPGASPPPYRLDDLAADSPPIDIGVDDIVARRGWNGADYDRTRAPGVAVLGTYVRSDADTGELVLRARRGSRFYYRTGPGGGQLVYRIGDGRRFHGHLPTATNWVMMTLDHPELPDTFEITLTDGGQTWGEWLAVGLRPGAAAGPEAATHDRPAGQRTTKP